MKCDGNSRNTRSLVLRNKVTDFFFHGKPEKALIKCVFGFVWLGLCLNYSLWKDIKPWL